MLFSRTLRDWLFMLRNQTAGGMYTVYATEDVIAETMYWLRRKNPKAPGTLIARVHDRIVKQLDDRITDFEIDGSYPGSDPDDAHVHAAAVASRASVLLTADSGFTDLDDAALDALPYEVQTPDSFFLLVDDASGAAVREVTRQQLDYWYSTKGEADLAKHLRGAGCPEFARRIADHVRSLDWMPP